MSFQTKKIIFSVSARVISNNFLLIIITFLFVVETDDSFKRVTENTSKVGDIVTGISQASKEQSMGIEQVSMALAKMDKVVQQNAANAEESASAAQEMNAQAIQLKRYICELTTLVKRPNDRDNKTDISPSANQGNTDAIIPYSG